MPGRSCNKGPIHLLGTLRDCGWIVTNAKTIRSLPSSIIKRYPSLPSEVIAAICSADSCVASDDKSWLLCLPDFSEESDSAFRWNKFELMSLEAAAGDDAWLATIKTFWDLHFPIWMSVADGYEFAAVDLTSDRHGTIVFGREPDFEETELVARCYAEFVAKLGRTNNPINPSGGSGVS